MAGEDNGGGFDEGEAAKMDDFRGVSVFDDRILGTGAGGGDDGCDRDAAGGGRRIACIVPFSDDNLFAGACVRRAGRSRFDLSDV